MKKYLMLILSAIMLLAILISCTEQETDSVNSSSSTVQSTTAPSTTVPSDSTSSTVVISPPSVTPPVDQPGTLDPSKPTKTVTWQFTYDYGFHHKDEVTLLVDYGYLGGDFNWIRIPNDIVAGDTITIEYTGDYIVLETYPSNIGLDGEVISYSFSYSRVISVSIEDLTGETLLDYDAPNNYIILDRSGRFTTLDKYDGDMVYLVEKQTIPSTDDEELCLKENQTISSTESGALQVVCMLAYNPRDLEDGVPENENISEIEARDIAHDHYYNRYFVRYEEQLEYEIVEAKSLDGYWQVHISEYWKGGCGYYYTIDKITGEIVSIEIAE